MRVGRSLHLLIVDDEHDTVATLSAILQDEGHSVSGAPNGVAALAEIRKTPPDAVIADINMPGVSGYDVAREVRRLYGEAAPMLVAPLKRQPPKPPVSLTDDTVIPSDGDDAVGPETRGAYGVRR